MQRSGKKTSTAVREPDVEGLPVVRPNVAAIDLASEIHWVCAPSIDRTGREVEQFGATTPELERMAEWLKERKVESVAMESTGVYWIAPHEVLERHGLEILRVNTRELARVPGRKKSDPVDCQWAQRLHSCGLWVGSFRPNERICMLRTWVRDRGNLVAASADWLRRMQKALDPMNVRVHRAVKDIDGMTAMAILRAIVKGERDPVSLAKFRQPHCQKSEKERADELTGHWREDPLFSLQESLKMYDAVQAGVADYDREILRKLAEMEREDCREQQAPKWKNANKARAIKTRGEEPLRQALYRMSGVDVTAMDAIGAGTVPVVLSEYGPDLSRFPSEKQFVQHAPLAPHKPTSGGKALKKKKRNNGSTRVAAALRMAATSLHHSETALGAYFRRIARHKGKDIAVFATARKLATLIYRLLRYGHPYVDEGAEAYEKRYREDRIKSLTAAVKALGFELTPKACDA